MTERVQRSGLRVGLVQCATMLSAAKKVCHVDSARRGDQERRDHQHRELKTLGLRYGGLRWKASQAQCRFFFSRQRSTARAWSDLLTIPMHHSD